MKKFSRMKKTVCGVLIASVLAGGMTNYGSISADAKISVKREQDTARFNIINQKNNNLKAMKEIEEAEIKNQSMMLEEAEEKQVELLNYLEYYSAHSEDEADWLWSQQLSNGAIAFYNDVNGTVSVNPYFSELTAISLIKHDNSKAAQDKIRKYLDWHFSHLNSAQTDYNGLAGTIYDYKVVLKDGEVVSEKSKGTYDSTDSYAALFLKVLSEYVDTYGDESYIIKHKKQIDEIVNVIFSTTADNGYTYAKPDYKICYLMDNTEVYSGLVAAKKLYKNVLKDRSILTKLTQSVAHYEENFEKDWWKEDHYAVTVSKRDCHENSKFSWEKFYPCITAQMFPVLYDLADVTDNNSLKLYERVSEAIDWKNMEYISNGTEVFYWCDFAKYAAKMNRLEDLNIYMSNYQKVIDGGRKYPLYSADSAKIVEACDMAVNYLQMLKSMIQD